MRFKRTFLTFAIILQQVFISIAQIDGDIEDFNFSENRKTYFFSKTSIVLPLFTNLPSNVNYLTHRNIGYETALLFCRNKYSSPFNISWGFAYSINNYHSNVHTWIFEPDVQSSEYVPQIYPDGFDYKKNKMLWSYLRLPAEMNFRFGKKEWEKFGFDIGAYLSLLLSASNVFVVDFVKTKTIYKDQINPIAYGIHTAFTYKKVSIFSNLNFNSFFRSENAPYIQLVNFGLSYSIFPPQFLF